ncbi:MAG: 7-cyano-7-deazaguanine synthase QueC [Nitrospirales bacterium]|nr:7-cyano-7-deazaguanine synthase QueC [Nitrospira sp.]MDR4502503.1 7-cyano-7-deazaguanine synthase QueC [Nitrospirales bacterium]
MAEGKAIILASGGLDSTVTAAIAKSQGFNLYLLTIAYGQRHGIEIDRAKQIAAWLEAKEHKIITLDLRTFGGSALTDDIEVPRPHSRTGDPREIPVTYVPARNMIFLSLAVAYAEVLEATRIYFGANTLDYSGYPDCRQEFVSAFTTMVQLGTKLGVEGQSIEILSPLIRMTKAEIIKKGLALNVPFALTHSCYAPSVDGRACGACESCVFRQEGFRAAGVDDPGMNTSVFD